MEITMTNEERIKSWMERWEELRDLAAANGDYLRWEAAEREIKNYEDVLKRWSVKEEQYGCAKSSFITMAG